jgi:hypothetical protein
MFIPDPGSLHIPDPGSLFLHIPDPGSKNSYKREGWKKFLVIPFFVATNFTKYNFLIFELLKTKGWAKFQRIIDLFTQKFVTKLSKIWQQLTTIFGRFLVPTWNFPNAATQRIYGQTISRRHLLPFFLFLIYDLNNPAFCAQRLFLHTDPIDPNSFLSPLAEFIDPVREFKPALKWG